MTDLLKQVIELAKDLSYEDNEALRAVLSRINYYRKDKIEEELKALIKA